MGALVVYRQWCQTNPHSHVKRPPAGYSIWQISRERKSTEAFFNGNGASWNANQNKEDSPSPHAMSRATWQAFHQTTQWRSARTHFSSLTSFCKTRTASASQQVVLSTPARLWVIETKPAPDKLDTLKKPAQDKLDTIKPAQRLEPKMAWAKMAHDATRQRVESSQRKNHEDHIASKGFASMTQYNFGAQVCAYAPSDENSRCKGSSGSRMKKARDDPSMVIGESQDKKKKESPLCHTDGRMSFQECGVRTKITKIQRQSRAPWWHCKRRLWGLRSFFTEQGSSAFQMIAAKVMDVIAILPDCDGQAADAVSPYTQLKLEDALDCYNSWVRMCRRYGHVSHDMNGQNFGQTFKIP